MKTPQFVIDHSTSICLCGGKLDTSGLFADLFTSEISTVFLYSMQAYFRYILPSRIRQRKYLSLINQRKNYRRASFIGSSQTSVARKRLGTWLGPVIFYILLRKYDLEVAQSHPYFKQRCYTLVLQVRLKYSRRIFFVMQPQIFFLQSQAFFTLTFSLRLNTLEKFSSLPHDDGRMRVRSPQIGGYMS